MYKQLKAHIRQFLSINGLAFIFLALIPVAVNAEETCLKCHNNINSVLQSSAHANLSCINCHSDITAYPHPEGAGLDKKEVAETCSKCHEGTVTESYQESYHGKAVALGSTQAASCSDCHGTHEILGEDQPASKVAKANIPDTCATCHKKAAPGFAEGKEHFQLTSTGDGAPMYYTSKFFIWLTIVVITALIIHIELQLFHNLRTILKERRRR